MNNKIFPSIVFIVFIVFLIWYKHEVLTDYQCTGNVNFHNNNSMLRFSTKLTLMRDRGVLSLNGVLIQSNGKRDVLNRTIVFKSTHVREHYTWISEEISTSIDEKISHEELKKWLSNFYLIKGGKIYIYINNINFNSVIISSDFFPYFICTKKH